MSSVVFLYRFRRPGLVPIFLEIMPSQQVNITNYVYPLLFVEVPGIEPGSFGAKTELLRA